MIYTCKNCLYVFESKKEPERCPDFGKFDITLSNADEQHVYKKLLTEFGHDK